MVFIASNCLGALAFRKQLGKPSLNDQISLTRTTRGTTHGYQGLLGTTRDYQESRGLLGGLLMNTRDYQGLLGLLGGLLMTTRDY